MTTALSEATLIPPLPTLAPGPEDEVFTIAGLSWEQYVAINEALGDRAGLRTLYLNGSLTFVSPAALHDEGEEALDTIVKAVAVGCHLPLRPIASTTLRRAGVSAGVEGDRVYYLGASVGALRGVRTIDLNQHPAPNLALEIENTHKATTAVAIYGQLGVPEVWRHDVRRTSLTFLHLQGDGTYSTALTSRVFPFLTTADVLDQLRLAHEIQSYTEWSEILAAWVRDVIRPRLDRP